MAYRQDQNDDLLAAKLSIPEIRSGVVSRRDLIKRARGSGCRVVSVTAAAGYGKTTLLVQWAKEEERSIAFVSFDRFDDDPVSLIRLLASAMGTVSPTGSTLVSAVGGPGVAVLGRAAPRLASAIRSCPTPFVLMLDDLHELNSPTCHDVLGLVMSGVPDHSQLVVASRSEQPQLPRLRAAGEAMELTAVDLAIAPTGAQEIFASHDLSLTEDEASLLTHHTEGWPVGLALAALIAKEGGEGTLSITGEDPYVADYLYNEALAQLPDAMQTFLQRTAVLGELSGPLCDAVLLQSGSSQALRQLEDSRLFLVPLDRRREWFRYHGLFREFLFSRLRTLEPDLIPELHRRAADWYESEGEPEKAIEHLLNTSEQERCAELVAMLTLPTFQAGHVSTLNRWFATIGDSAIEEHPTLALMTGMVAALTGHTSEAERYMAVVNEASYDGTPPDGTASFDSGRAILRTILCQDGPEQMFADAQVAVEQEPSWSPWRDSALCVLGEALLLLGDRDRARSILEEAAALAESFSNTDIIVDCQSELAILAMDRGEWDEAGRHAERALTTVDEHRFDDYSVSVIAFASGARVALNQGDMQETERLLVKGMRARQFCTASFPFIAVRARLHLARAWLALAEVSYARHLLREINDILYQRPKLGALNDEIEEFRTEVASTTTRMPGRAPLTPAELRLLPYLQTHLTVPEIAERLFVSRNTVRTQVASVYRKLGVGSRAEAVEKASEVGLVGG